MNKKLFFILLTGLTTLALGACTQNLVDEGTAPGYMVPVDSARPRLNNVGFLTDNLEKKISVQQSGGERTATGTLKVWCQLRNRTDFPQKIQARTLFYDKDKRPLDDQPMWKDIFLAPNSMELYNAYSLSTQARYYYIEIKEMP